MLHERGGNIGQGSSERECKPDYEEIIKRQRESLQKTENLLNAAIDYIGGSSARGKLAEMIGELYTEKLKFEEMIQGLIKRQEEDK